MRNRPVIFSCHGFRAFTPSGMCLVACAFANPAQGSRGRTKTRGIPPEATQNRYLSSCLGSAGETSFLAGSEGIVCFLGGINSGIPPSKNPQMVNRVPFYGANKLCTPGFNQMRLQRVLEVLDACLGILAKGRGKGWQLLVCSEVNGSGNPKLS